MKALWIVIAAAMLVGCERMQSGDSCSDEAWSRAWYTAVTCAHGARLRVTDRMLLCLCSRQDSGAP